MSTDNLRMILQMIRAELPEPTADEVWERIERAIRGQYGGERPYIAAHSKRSHLEIIAEAGENASAQQLAKMMGVSVRRAQQLKKLWG